MDSRLPRTAPNRRQPAQRSPRLPSPSAPASPRPSLIEEIDEQPATTPANQNPRVPLIDDP